VSVNIPTTADVRDAYSSESTDSTYANRMFDLWLAQYKAKVIAKAEERIIKLLEEALVFDEPVIIQRDRLIALIKGENNGNS
jgi:hypothetical protein